MISHGVICSKEKPTNLLQTLNWFVKSHQSLLTHWLLPWNHPMANPSPKSFVKFPFLMSHPSEMVSKCCFLLLSRFNLPSFCDQQVSPAISEWGLTIAWKQMELALSNAAAVYRSPASLATFLWHYSPRSGLTAQLRFLNWVCSFISRVFATSTLSAVMCFPPLLPTLTLTHSLLLPAGSSSGHSSLLSLPEGVKTFSWALLPFCTFLSYSIYDVYIFPLSVFSSVCPSI